MTRPSTPSLNIHISEWSLLEEFDPNTEAGLKAHLKAVKEAGFQSYFTSPDKPNLKQLLAEYGLRYGGAFDASDPSRLATLIASFMEIDNGPINCQLADDDTPVEKAIELAILLMKEAKKQNAAVHLEVHRDTCTETPEKMTAIIEGYRTTTGEYPLMNFDFSHPAVVKHMLPKDTIPRLFTPDIIPIFQQSTLWHMRPFNAQHCQIPITDGQGALSPEYQSCRPFIRQALKYWLKGPRPTNQLWVVPELGTTHDYRLSCFPNIWQDTIILGKDIQSMWNELITELDG